MGKQVFYTMVNPTCVFMICSFSVALPKMQKLRQIMKTITTNVLMSIQKKTALHKAEIKGLNSKLEVEQLFFTNHRQSPILQWWLHLK